MSAATAWVLTHSEEVHRKDTANIRVGIPPPIMAIQRTTQESLLLLDMTDVARDVFILIVSVTPKGHQRLIGGYLPFC